MSETKLKLVLFFDPETQVYKPSAHNLLPNQAVEHVENLQSEGVDKAAIVGQTTSHRPLKAQRCKACRQAAEDFAKRLGEATTQEVQSPQNHTNGKTDPYSIPVAEREQPEVFPDEESPAN